LFLDEIGELGQAVQVKLLRVMQDHEVRRVGSTTSTKVDVRIIAATNRDLEQLVKEGKYRDDLFYRLNVVRITLPSLVERRDDIPMLVHHFLQKCAAGAAHASPAASICRGSGSVRPGSRTTGPRPRSACSRARSWDPGSCRWGTRTTRKADCPRRPAWFRPDSTRRPPLARAGNSRSAAAPGRRGSRRRYRGSAPGRARSTGLPACSACWAAGSTGRDCPGGSAGTSGARSARTDRFADRAWCPADSSRPPPGSASSRAGKSASRSGCTRRSD